MLLPFLCLICVLISRLAAQPSLPVLVRDDSAAASRRPISHDPDAPSGTSSLAFVFDVTGSMYDDLVQVREGAKRIFATVLAQREKLIYNYVLVPFHDPEVGPYVATTDTQYFQRKLQNLYVQGGGDCPEMAVSGIKMALEASLPSSFIYVFTDARAKDYQLTDAVLNLIQEKQSQVVFVMTGDCGNRSHPGYKAFERIASTSSGQIFHLEKRADVSEVLNYVRVIVQNRKVSLISLDRETDGAHVIRIPIDSHLYEFTVSLSGDEPEINLVDPKGQHISETNGLRTVLNLGNVLVYNVKTPKPGMWTLRTFSKGKHTIRVTGIGGIDFVHGFSSRIVDSIEKTHNRPLQGLSTYLMINVTSFPANGVVGQVELVNAHGKILYASAAQQDKNFIYLYTAGQFMPPEGYYFIKINGIDDKSHEFQRISLTAITGQIAAGPKAFMASKYIGFRDSSLNLTCQVESVVPFTLYWFKESVQIAGPLFYRSSDSAIWQLANLDPRDNGYYKCMVISSSGNFSVETHVETKEPPPKLIAPKNVTAVLGANAHLHCRAQSSVTATITWQRRGVPLQNTDQYRIMHNGTLRIEKVALDNEGPYVCHVITAGGDATTEIYLSILEPPEVLVEPKFLYFPNRGAFNISCLVSGEPRPEIKWYFQGEPIITSYKHYITHENELLVREATKENAGPYECRATSTAGSSSDFSSAQLAIAPKIKVPRDRVLIGKGESVALECEISEGTPTPTIIWYKDGREIGAFHHMNAQNGRLTIKSTEEIDDGHYSCLAENMAGRFEGRIRLDVGGPPVILPAPAIIYVSIDHDATLQCRVTGHPVPEITWSRDGRQLEHSNKFQKLPDGGLLIRSVDLKEQGNYLCSTTNRFGRQEASRQLVVTGLVSPVLAEIQPAEQVIAGRMLRINCAVLAGNPKPILNWFKDDKPLVSGANVQIEIDGSSLMIQSAMPGDEGRYTCRAVNPAGNATITVRASVITPPVFEPAPLVLRELVVREGQTLSLPCNAIAKPKPYVSWTRDQRPLTSSAEYAIQPNGSLLIKETSAQDSGLYICKALNPAGAITLEYNVSIQAPPKLVYDKAHYTVVEGKSITIKCQANALPMPTVRWFSEDGITPVPLPFMVTKDSSLHLHRATQKQSGLYICRAENIVGKDERVVRLSVHTRPTIAGSGERRFLTTRIDETVNLSCPAISADPRPSWEWMYENRLIKYSALQDIRFLGDDVLQIPRVKAEHSGTYSCTISNIVGNDTVSFHLKVEEPPKIYNNVGEMVTLIKGMKLLLMCQSSGVPSPMISWRRNGLEIIPSDLETIQNDGSLLIHEVNTLHSGVYKCTAKNSAGYDTKEMNVTVHEPPTILSSTQNVHSVIQGEKIILKCSIVGTPKPSVTWYRQSKPVVTKEQDSIYEKDGELFIDGVRGHHQGLYTCKAINDAGVATHDILVNVTVPPLIKDQDVVVSESVSLGSPINLYCPVYSTPTPKVAWYLNNRILIAADSRVHFSSDNRRIIIPASTVSDGGTYRCVASNPAGQSFKDFRMDILVPPLLDESKLDKRIEVMRNHSALMNCPVTGNPSPDISWLLNGRLLISDSLRRGVRMSDDKKELIIKEAQIEDEGTYTCVASNVAGTLEVDSSLVLLSNPELGPDEVVETVAGSSVTLDCSPKDAKFSTSITWIKENQEAQESAGNVRVGLSGRKLYVNKVELYNDGIYTCIVRNLAGETHKNVYLRVLIPPSFKERNYNAHLKVPIGKPLTLKCITFGNPEPETTWEKDGVELSQNGELFNAIFEENGQSFTIPDVTNGYQKSVFTCTAKNGVGVATRDFYVDTVAPPVLSSSGGKTTLVTEVMGEASTLECPVSSTSTDHQIIWYKDGQLMQNSHARVQISADQKRIRWNNLIVEDEGTYTCLVKNPAGEAWKEFKVDVIVPPLLIGSNFEYVEILEGNALSLKCPFEAESVDKIEWDKNGMRLPSNVQILTDNTAVYVHNALAANEGSYHCSVRNKAGIIEKTFRVKIVSKPRIDGAAHENDTVAAAAGSSIVLMCPIQRAQGGEEGGIEIVWLKDNVPLESGVAHRILPNGKYLYISNSKPSDAGGYVCIAKNRAGSIKKAMNLVVEKPPTIMTNDTDFIVPVNQSLLMSCDTESNPQPNVQWTFSNQDIDKLHNIQILNSGRQLRIASVELSNKGRYVCTATNKLGSADVSFNVDVIAPPTIDHDTVKTIEVLVNSSAVLKCPISSNDHMTKLIWLKDREPIRMNNNRLKHARSRSGRRLYISNFQIEDEGLYTCHATNQAGENAADVKVSALEMPSIVSSSNEDAITAVESSSVVLKCPVNGRPKPTVSWLKDGQALNAKQNVAVLITSDSLFIANVTQSSTGTYTCLAENKVGRVEKDQRLIVATPPKIQFNDLTQQTKVLVNDEVVFQCLVIQGHPKSELFWIKDGLMLKSSDRYYISSDRQKLRILSAKLNDTGLFTCTAKNVAGDSAKEFFLKVISPPRLQTTNLPQVSHIIAGKSVNLKCPVEGYPRPNIAWMKNGFPLILDRRIKILFDGQELQITQSSKNDSGHYSCIATNEGGSADLSFKLKVLASPEISGPPEEIVNTMEAGIAALSCEASGSESLEITWMKNRQDISSIDSRAQVSSQGRLLNILDAKTDDEGVYVCLARNAAGEASKTFQLMVHVKPKINETLSSPVVQSTFLGHMAHIQCYVKGKPSPRVYWLKDEKNIENAYLTYRISRDNQTIWIKGSNHSTTGRYTCYAENDVGMTTKDFFLKFIDPPKFDINSEAKEVKVGERLILPCINDSIGEFNGSWLFNERPINRKLLSQFKFDKHRLELFEAKLSDTGSYACVVRNEAGTAKKNYDVTVVRSPSFIDLNDTTKAIITGKSAQLNCSVSGVPAPVIRWLKDGLDFSPRRNVKLTDDDRILQIFTAEAQDAGFYTCVAENKIGRIEKDFLVRIKGLPKIHKSDQSTEVYENDTVTLECPGNGENLRRQWTKNGRTITLQNVHESYDSRKLKIARAQSFNGGLYTCILENEAGKVAISFVVVVLVPPQVDAASLIEAPSGQYVNISCRANGHPKPEITWSKNGGSLPMNVVLFSSGHSSVLQILVDFESDDIYSCLASNKAGKSTKDILVRATNRPSLVKFTDLVKVVEGEPVTLKCQVEAGKPYPEVKWTKNLQSVPGLSVNVPRNKEHHLLIAKANLSHSGDYTCVASNKFGHSRVVTRLHVLSPPTIDNVENTLNVIENESISINCPVKGYPSPVVVWYKNGDKIGSTENLRDKYRTSYHNLLINSIQVSDSGRYSCEARNEAGFARSDFLIDVYVKPRFRHAGQQDLLVIGGRRLILNCDFESNPRAQITWLKSGRPLNESIGNIIRSPMGHRLMIANAQVTDSGSYSCIAKNAAGENEAIFNVVVAVLPKLMKPIDQNPQIIVGQSLSLECPISAVPEAKINWRKNGEVVEKIGSGLYITNGSSLIIPRAQMADQGRYRCEASNEAGNFDVEFIVDVIAPPRFKAKIVDYEVVEGQSITLDCAMDTVLEPSFLWFKSNSSIHSGNNIMLPNNGQQLTILKSRASDAGKYICRSTNLAGTADVQITLNVLIPPKIDLSNVVGNPLAKLNQSVTLECPAFGYPSPIIKWYRDQKLIDRTGDRYIFSANNQTIKLMDVQSSDAGTYSCAAENKAGKIEQKYNLEVLLPPILSIPQEPTNITLTEGDSLSITCPVSLDSPLPDISWTKDGAQLSVDSIEDLRMSYDSRKIFLRRIKVSDSGVYMCIATNRAGESHLTFLVDVLSPPVIDETRNEPHTKAVPGQNVVLWCVATAKPSPSIRWYKNGKELLPNQDPEIRISSDRNSLTFASIKTLHNGHYTCIAENPAGRRELGLTVEILLPPSVKLIVAETSIKSGHSVALICEVAGFPEPNITWTKNGRALDLIEYDQGLSLKSRKLEIKSFRPKDVGRYTCTARNVAGFAEDHTALDILIPPEIRRSGLKLHVRIAVSQSVTLHCEASGKPTPRLVWHKDNRLLSSSSNVEVAPAGQFLRIKNSKPEDQAIYKCTARNEVGEDSIAYNVQVVQTPKIGSGSSVQVIEGQNALLSCDVSAFPPPQVIWQRNGQRVNTGGRYVIQNNNLRISAARSADAGMYVCVASNDAGTAQQAYILDVLIGPKMLIVDTETITVPLGETFELKCLVKGHPEPSTTWHMDMQIVKTDLHRTVVANGSLIVMNAAISDAGDYKCVRTNAAGTAVKSYTVRIIRPPHLSDESMKIINVTESNPALLACRFDAEDGAKVFWHKDDVPLASYYNPRMALVNSDLHLIINDTRLIDTGSYKCSAVNPAGNITQLFQLNVGVPPKITPEPRRVVVLNGSNAELPCEAIGHPKPCVTWMHGSETISEVHQKGTSLFFTRSRPENSSVYTCKAHNWAGEAYHDVELAVYVPPTVTPERFNATERENVSIVLECKATGIPEPTVAWFKEPRNTAVLNDDKYSISSDNSLTIKNLKKTDDGFYRCVASNEAGVAIGHRRLHIAQPDWRILFVECDKNGKPIRMTYVPARGDIPSDYHKLLPWSAEDQDLPENGTANTLIKCLPSRDVRKQRNHLSAIATIPKLVKLPENQVVKVGDTVKLTCEGVGNPVPEVLWTLNGRPIDDNPVTVDGRSVLTITDVQKSAAGRYMCIARNHKGSTRAVAVLRVNDAPQRVAFLRANGQTSLRYSQTVSILTCKIPNNLNNGRIFWMKNGRIVRPDHDRITILKNGTLILNNVDDDEAREYQCVIDKKHVATRLMEKTIIEHDSNRESAPRTVLVKAGKPLWLNCRSLSYGNQPTHHRSIWFHNDKPLEENSWRINILHNQTLWIKYAYIADLGDYKCMSFDRFGRIAGIAKYLLKAPSCSCRFRVWGFHSKLKSNQVTWKEKPVEMTANVQGTVNGVRLKDASMFGTVTSNDGKGEVEIRLENLPLNISVNQDQTLLSSAIAPCWLAPFVNIKTTGHHSKINAELFESRAEYRFSTGETLKLQQRGRLSDSKGYVVMDLAIDGSVPHLSENSVVIMEPYIEHLVRSNNDRMQGYGTGTYNVKGVPEGVSFSWNQDIKYKIGAESMKGRAEKIRVSALTLNDARSGAYRYETSTESEDICPDGFEVAINGMYCTDVDECETDSHGCSLAGNCTNLPGSYHCSAGCARGFVPSSFSMCRDIDECKSNISVCPLYHECQNTPGSYECKEMCRPGFTREGNVCVDVDECEGRNPCAKSQYCTNTVGSYKCFCQAGYTVKGYENKCEDIDECSLMPSVCQYGCQNTLGSYFCTCPHGLTLLPDGRTCSGISYNYAKSVDDNTLSKKDFDSCPVGYHFDGSICVESRSCNRDSECQFQCKFENGIGSCACPAGYRLNPDGRSCDDIDECAEDTAHCFGDKMCFNQRGGYECLRVECPDFYIFSPRENSCILQCLTDGLVCPPDDDKVQRIQVQLASLPLGVRAFRDVIRLTAYDSRGRQLRRTHFILLNDFSASYRQSTHPPFSVRVDQGRGILFTLKRLDDGSKKYRLRIRAVSYDESSPNLKYRTEFLIFVHVAGYPF